MIKPLPGGKGQRRSGDHFTNQSESYAQRLADRSDSNGWVVSNCDIHQVGAYTNAAPTANRFYLIRLPVLLRDIEICSARTRVTTGAAGNVAWGVYFMPTIGRFEILRQSAGLYTTSSAALITYTYHEPFALYAGEQYFFGAVSTGGALLRCGTINRRDEALLYVDGMSTAPPAIAVSACTKEYGQANIPCVTLFSKIAGEVL